MRPGRPPSVSHPATGPPDPVAGGVASPGRARLSVTLGRMARQLAARLTATRRRRIVLLLSVLLPAGLFVPPAAWTVHHVYFDRTDVPDLTAFLRFEPLTTGVVRDARGAVLVELAREYRRVVTYDEVPVILRQAILAAEDKRFFSHSGVDYRALPRVVQKTAVRSISEWWKGGGGRLLLPQGGSTLTQQLVRGYFLADLTRRSDRSALFHTGLAPPRLLSLVLGASATNKLLRKLEEVRLTLWLEREMRRRFGTQDKAKREIFGRYASFIYLGNGRYGFAAASEYYFARPLSSYTGDDAGIASLLSAIGKAPRDYAPAPGNLRLIRRRNQILVLMARYGYISAALSTRCRGEPIRVAPVAPDKTVAPAAIDHVLTELSERAGTGFVEDLFEGRVVVRSTVDARVQAIVNDALEHGLALYEKRHPAGKGVIQGSVVVLANADASILAEAGGRRVFQGRNSRYADYNRVTGSLRQPGSAMKPLVYLAAFESGLALDTTVPDEPIEVPAGDGVGFKQIANYDNQFKGPIPVRQALAESRNAVAVWITREIGVGKVIRTARKMGIRSPLQPYLSTALGASEVRLLELADAYRAIASGVLAEPHVIDRVTDTADNAAVQGAANRAVDRLRGGPRDSGGAAGRRPPAGRHGPQPRRARLSDPGDGQDRHDQRLSRCALRRIHLRHVRDHRGRANRLRRRPPPGSERNRRTHGTAGLPRGDAPRVPGPARRKERRASHARSKPASISISRPWPRRRSRSRAASPHGRHRWRTLRRAGDSRVARRRVRPTPSSPSRR